MAQVLVSSLTAMSTGMQHLSDGIRESQRRATRGLETLHNGINSLTWLARLNQIATAGHHDPMLQHGDLDALDEAIHLLKSVVLPALQERVLDNSMMIPRVTSVDAKHNLRMTSSMTSSPQLNADAALTRIRRRGPHRRRRGPHGERMEMR